MAKPLRWLSRLYLAGFVALALGSAWHGDFFLFYCLAGGLTLGWVLRPILLKRALVASLGAWRVHPASPDEFPRLDRERVELLARELEALGFQKRGTFANGHKNPAFSLLLEHPTEGAIAEVSQVFVLKRALPVMCAVFSYWGDAGSLQRFAARLAPDEVAAPLSSPEGTAPRLPERVIGEEELPVWNYGTHDRPTNVYWKVLRHPRVLGTRLPPGTAPAELWRVHLERRAVLNKRIPAPRVEGDLVQVTHAHTQVITQLWRALARRAALWRFYARAQSASSEFLGEFGP